MSATPGSSAAQPVLPTGLPTPLQTSNHATLPTNILLFNTPVSTSSSSSPGSRGRTNAISGVVVGGITALLILFFTLAFLHHSTVGEVASGIAALLAIFIGLFYWRRKRPHEDSDDNFEVDPDPIISHVGAVDLGADIESNPYHSEPGVGGVASGPSPASFHGGIRGSMRQYGDSQAFLSGSVQAGLAPTTTSGSHYASTSDYGASAHPALSGRGGTGSLGSSGFSQPGPSHPLSSDPLRQHGDGLGLATAPNEGDQVIRHLDGGHVIDPIHPTQSRELPPSYDSIPVDHGEISMVEVAGGL